MRITIICGAPGARAAVAGVVEDQVTGLQVAQAHPFPDLALGVRIMRQLHTPGLLEHMRNQAAAVEAGFRRATAPLIVRADQARKAQENSSLCPIMGSA